MRDNCQCDGSCKGGVCDGAEEIEKIEIENRAVRMAVAIFIVFVAGPLMYLYEAAQSVVEMAIDYLKEGKEILVTNWRG
jgi:hypothetical protein